MNGSILTKIQNGELSLSLLCDTLEEQETLAPIMSEIRRLVEEHLESNGAEGLLVCRNSRPSSSQINDRAS